MANNNTLLAFLMGAATGAALALYLKTEKGKEAVAQAVDTAAEKFDESKAKVSDLLDKIEEKLASGLASDDETPAAADEETPAAESAEDAPAAEEAPAEPETKEE